MGALRGYFDDSGHEPDPHCNCVVYAGYIGNCAEWTRLEEGWKIALDRAGVPYLHMKELMSIDRKPPGFVSPYNKWRGNPEAVNSFLLELARIVTGTSLRPIAAAVDKEALARLNTKLGLTKNGLLEAESLAVYACGWLAQDSFGEHISMEFLVDKIAKPGRLYYLIEAISAHESREVPILDHITFTFLAKNTPSRHPTDGSQNIYALQVADFLAWETHFFARERIKNGYESADRLRRETYDVIAPDSDWPLSMFLNDRTLTNWSDQKKGAWPNTRQGRLVKSWVEFSQELERKLKN